MKDVKITKTFDRGLKTLLLRYENIEETKKSLFMTYGPHEFFIKESPNSNSCYSVMWIKDNKLYELEYEKQKTIDWNSTNRILEEEE